MFEKITNNLTEGVLNGLFLLKQLQNLYIGRSYQFVTVLI